MKATKIAATLALAALSVSACKTAPVTDQPPAQVAGSDLGPMATKWAAEKQPASMISFFKDTFDVMNIHVAGSDEVFSVTHTGTAFAFNNGKSDKANFDVELASDNIENLIAYAQDGEVDDQEATNIMAVLFTPLTQQLLNHPVTKDPDLREKSGVEALIHTVLVGPDAKPVAAHTMRYENELWKVAPGLDGTPERVFKVNARQAAEYQRHAFAAVRSNNPIGWINFVSWYKEWREGVSTIPGA